MKELMKTYPGRVPVVLERDPKCSNIPDIDKKKYLVPGDYTVGQFVYAIRTRINLQKSVAMFVLVDNILPSTSDLMSHMYKMHKNENGLLHITYTGENTFGRGVLLGVKLANHFDNLVDGNNRNMEHGGYRRF